MQEGRCGRVFKRERMEEGKALYRAGINKIQQNARDKKPPKNQRWSLDWMQGSTTNGGRLKDRLKGSCTLSD